MGTSRPKENSCSKSFIQSWSVYLNGVGKLKDWPDHTVLNQACSWTWDYGLLITDVLTDKGR